MKGKTHELVNLIFFPPTIYILPEEVRVPFALGYLMGTFFMSPDIDLYYSRSSRRWRILRIVWFPLWVLTKHRGIIHKPFIGTFLKLFYIFSISLLLFQTLQNFLNIDIKFENLNISMEQVLYFIFGIVIADLLHIFFDFLSTKLKRLFQ